MTVETRSRRLTQDHIMRIFKGRYGYFHMSAHYVGPVYIRHSRVTPLLEHGFPPKGSWDLSLPSSMNILNYYVVTGGA